MKEFENLSQEYLKIVIKRTGQNIEIRKQINRFSQIFSMDSILPGLRNNDNSEINQMITYEIPEETEVTGEHIKILRQFAKVHEYCIEKVQVNKMLFSSTNSCFGKLTAKFVSQSLSPLTLSQLRDLLKTFQYLRAKQIQNVIVQYIAIKCMLPYNCEEINTIMKTNGIKQYDKYELAKLKQQMFAHMQSYSLDILQRYEQKKKLKKE